MAILDVPALLKPIPGGDPGGPHPSQVRDKDPNRDPTALDECRTVADEMLMAVEGDAPPAAEALPATGGDPSASVAAAPDKISRAGLYKQLGQIADHLGRLEPHSPVPFLLRRVLELQDLPFPQLVREFTKSSESVLAFLERSLSESPASQESTS